MVASGKRRQNRHPDLKQRRREEPARARTSELMARQESGHWGEPETERYEASLVREENLRGAAINGVEVEEARRKVQEELREDEEISREDEQALLKEREGRELLVRTCSPQQRPVRPAPRRSRPRLKRPRHAGKPARRQQVRPGGPARGPDSGPSAEQPSAYRVPSAC